ncbi:hypothetical protein Tco_0714330 [Tanacetum coccineum]
MPPISFPNKLEFVRQEELSEKVLRRMEVRSLRIEEEILHANVESITKQNGSIYNPSSIPSINDIASVPIDVSEISKEFDDELLSASLTDKKAECNECRGA